MIIVNRRSSLNAITIKLCPVEPCNVYVVNLTVMLPCYFSYNMVELLQVHIRVRVLSFSGRLLTFYEYEQ
jgi:hypothetical protein